MRIDRSARLTEAVERGELDLAVDVTEGTPVGDLPLCWFAAPGWKPPAAGPLPLLAVNVPCVIRRRALTELAADRCRRRGCARPARLLGDGPGGVAPSSHHVRRRARLGNALLTRHEGCLTLQSRDP